jgi:hypothetical protein
MQLELRSAVAQLLSRIGSSSESWTGRVTGVGTGAGVGLVEGGNQTGGMYAERPFYTVPDIPSDYTVRYRQLAEEIIVGGVYIRLFMKQPTFRLSNPIFFLERLVELWEHSFNKQVPTESSSEPSLPRSEGDDRGITHSFLFSSLLFSSLLFSSFFLSYYLIQFTTMLHFTILYQ